MGNQPTGLYPNKPPEVAQFQHTYNDKNSSVKKRTTIPQDDENSEFTITHSSSSHQYLPNHRFSSVAELEPNPDLENDIIEIPEDSEWDVSASVLKNRPKPDYKTQVDRHIADLSGTVNQTLDAMTSSVSQWNSGDWDLNKSYSNMKDSYNKFEKDVTDGTSTIIGEVSKVKAPSGMFGDFGSFLADVASATMDELLGDETRVINKNVGFFEVDSSSSSEKERELEEKGQETSSEEESSSSSGEDLHFTRQESISHDESGSPKDVPFNSKSHMANKHIHDDEPSSEDK